MCNFFALSCHIILRYYIRKEGERAIKMEENQAWDVRKKLKVYKNVLDEIDVGVQVIDEEGKTFIYNKKKMQLESMNPEDVLNKNILEVFKFKNAKESRLLQALENGVVTKNAKQTYFTVKGMEITTINNTYPLIEDGKIIGAVEIANDVTKFERFKENIFYQGNTRYTFESIIGKSPAIKEVIENTKRATRTASSVLIVGETGTGKELFAQSIHTGSNRSHKPFISQNCAAMPDSLIESLLFGTKKGAFTGSTEHPGLFEQAEGGTLLLDEINSLNPNLQAKLLRAIQERMIRRVGDTKDTKINVRIIATINEDPIEAIANNHLRKDLFYRLSVVTLFVPPLRERKEDIPLLVHKFIDKYNRLFQMNVKRINTEVEELFYSYHWPGNVRELEHIIEGAMNLIGNEEEEIQREHLPFHFLSNMNQTDAYSNEANTPNTSSSTSILEEDLTKQLKDKLNEYEFHYIKRVLEQNNNNITRSAEILGISRQSLQYRLRKFNYRKKDKKD